MPYDNSRMRREIGKYIQHQQDSNLSPKYVRQVKELLGKFLTYCRGRGVRSVKRVRVDEIRDFMAKYSTMSAGYQRFTYTRLRGFLAHWENPSVAKFKLRVRGAGRTRVDWLTPFETEQVLGTPMTAREAVLIRAGLLQGLRKCEILRMIVAEAQRAVEMGTLSVKGKGGKSRAVPLHKGFAEALRAYLSRLAVTDHAEHLIPFAEGWVAEIVVRFSLRFGRRFTTHTLRRTFGRNLWLRGIPIETIAELMGHASTDTTRLYLGLNITDMRKAISEYGTKSELKILDVIPERRIAPQREKDLESDPLLERGVILEGPGL